MKPGDIVQTFGNPMTCEIPLGQARLVKKLEEKKDLELWQVEYLDDEGHFYTQLIKKLINGENKAS